MYENILAKIRRHLKDQGLSKTIYDDLNKKNRAQERLPPPIPHKRLCYICRLSLTNPHPSTPALCLPCGIFNHSSSLLSTPAHLSLPPTFTALVTGARVNLGFHTALRLLRCGARVIATSRYPRDAVTRYLAKKDSGEWRDRLRVVGADFRCARDAFQLVGETKGCLRGWADGEGGKGGEGRLCLLINNAAQTLTDSVVVEERAVLREKTLKDLVEGESSERSILIESTYTARVRGRPLPITLQDGRNSKSEISWEWEGVNGVTETEAPPEFHLTEIVNGPSAALSGSTNSGSSWTQSLSSIPYTDIISAHSINTFVPLILIRELLPLMGVPSYSLPPSLSTRPHGYILNISSREGISESRLSSTAKSGKHVHTNMSKAALNMITETEAAVAWKGRRVAMNTVDPGYMSAAPEFEDAWGGVRPIGWEDGAGRVLWSVAVGEQEGWAVWGRFLKHYGAIGRGDGGDLVVLK
ncbi:hypothetical protein BCR34DRAFT_622577 [Clohesyomyces aquaticus]|uniref:NAD(P)-binding protein n=1 Tax=Clohesyomyces aquaticus TaxID=1231657 RepID=A0A1Y2A0D5_9PLEO|nr:hypothetical protein BCR34DRAFT_622577 [Clohesyomyces aquaticus]